jgi:hypothetical protein
MAAARGASFKELMQRIAAETPLPDIGGRISDWWALCPQIADQTPCHRSLPSWLCGFDFLSAAFSNVCAFLTFVDT